MLKKVTVLLLIGVLLLTGTVFAATTLEKVKKTGKLKVALNATYPPFEFFDNDKKEYMGFDIDMAKGLAKEIGVEAEIINTAWDGIIPGLLSKQYDIIISAMTITEERAKKVQFSDPYYYAGQIIVVRKEQTGIEKPADLKGKKVGVQIGTTGDFAASEVEGAEVVRYDTIDLAVAALQNKNIDAVVSDAPTMASYAKVKEDITLSGDIFTAEEYGMAMRLEDKDLHEAVNKALANLKESGKIQEFMDNWTGGK